MSSDCIFGINLPVLRDAYNHDLAPNQSFPEWKCEFKPYWAFRYLAICKKLGFSAVRLWLCEGAEGIKTDGSGKILGVMQELLDSIRAIQDGARMLGLQIYWTLLDGNSWHRNHDEITGKIIVDPSETTRFAEKVAAPIGQTLDPDLTFALEVLNEPESMSSEILGDDGLSWESLVTAIRTTRDVLHQAIPGVPITSGSQAIFLPGLLADVVSQGIECCPVDAIDIHVYHHDGGLPPREDLPVDIADLPLLCGECGLSHKAKSDRSDYLLHYLYNARDLGYRAAFLWKLEGNKHLIRRESIENSTQSEETFRMNSLAEQIRAFLESQRV